MPEPTADERAAEIRAAVERMFSGSNWRKSAEETVKDNFKIRRKLQEAKTRITELEAAAPKDGAVVLKKEDSEELVAYRALGKVADLKTVVAEHGALKVKDQARTEQESFAEAAESLGYKNVVALTRVLTREGLVLEFKDVRVKGEDGKFTVERVPQVRPKADDKAQLEPLDDYLQRELPDFIAVFESEPSGGDEDGDDDAGDEKDGAAEMEELTTSLQGEQDTGRSVKRGKTVRGGVAIAATRNVNGVPSVAGKNQKKMEQIEKEARESSMYVL